MRSRILWPLVATGSVAVVVIAISVAKPTKLSSGASRSSELGNVPNTRSDTLQPVDRHIFEWMFQGRRGLVEDLPWSVSYSVRFIRKDTPPEEVPYLRRWLALVDGFRLLTDPTAKEYEEETARRLREGTERIIEELGPAPTRFQVANAAIRTFDENRMLARLVAYADARGVPSPKTVPPRFAAVAPDYLKTVPGIIALGREPSAKFTCLKLFSYCASLRSIVIKSYGLAELERCKQAHETLMKRATYAKRFSNAIGPLQLQAASLDPGSSSAITGLWERLYQELDQVGIAAELEASSAAGDDIALDFAEPQFDLVEPRRVGRGEM